jgi:hypothetical protein
MTSSKPEDSVSPSHLSDRAASENREKLPAGQLTPAYESATFSSPALDQLRGILPDFNNRLSPERDLGLSSLGVSRLSPEPLPRLVSDSALGLVSGSRSSPLNGLKIENHKTPVGLRFEVKPDLAGRTLSGNKTNSLTLCADLPIRLVESRMVTLRSVENEKREK